MTGHFKVLPVLAALSLAMHASAVDYSTDVQPILAEHCLECHGPDSAKGGLSLVTREAALKPLKSGAHGIIPSSPDQSAIVQRITTPDIKERMPPRDKKGLSPKEIETLRTWIAQGAPYDLHWAYKPVQLPPNITFTDWRQVDQFVTSKLQARGLTGSPSADAITLVKRLHYDLLGLPPAVETVDAFVKETQGLPLTSEAFDAAYARLIDRTLASPHYGERWGRHWLDAARYADSDGYEKDRPRPDAWRFRDWVIRSINEDMPFDQFTIEQIAGDLLPEATAEQVVATAFHRQTLTNTEGGTDQEQFRIEACMDRTETLGTVWLGLTVGCARCHTHKYDQITIQDYYRLFSFFNNADEVTRQAPESPEKWAAYLKANGEEAAQIEKLQKQLDAAKALLPAKLPEWEKRIQQRLAEAGASGKNKQTFTALPVPSITAASNTAFKNLPDGSWLAEGSVPDTDVYHITTRTPALVQAIRIETLHHASLPKQGPGRNENGNFVLSEVELLVDGIPQVLHSPVADFTQSKFTAQATLDGNDQTGWAIGGGVGQDHSITFQLAEPVPAGTSMELKLRQHYKNKQHLIGCFRLLTSSEITQTSILPQEVANILSEEPKRRNPVLIQPLWRWLEKVDPSVVSATRALQEAKARLPDPPLIDVRVIAERSANRRSTHVLERGDFLSPAEPVTPATPAVLPALGKKDATRLDLARWLVRKDNPLTPRVTVNHVWSRLFGEGLVRTVADFGVRGEKPTHPELLDFLAVQFMNSNWSRKRLLKTILMSRTYRQSSHSRPGSREASDDPLNTLLWRQNRLRVEGEIVRDLHLAASGLLSAKIGGPSVFPPMPPDVADLSYANNFKWTTSTAEDRYRRGMYTFFKRTAPHPDLMTFDCPDANITNVKRTVSNTPLQALTTLNAEAFSEAAAALAARVLAAGGNDKARIILAFRLCLARQPDSAEVQSLDQLLTEARKWYADHPDQAIHFARSQAGGKVLPVEIAAWTATTRIILNLDEMIVRD